MKIAVIQSGNAGFFPRFYSCLKHAAERRSDHVQLFCPNSGLNRRNPINKQILFGSKWNWAIHFNLYKLTGLQDIFSVTDTLDLIRKLKKYNPDIIHLQVVNAWIINFPLFVKYLNKQHIKVVWTMHDCRAFTGRCAYFDEVNCDKWLTGCGICPQKKLYWPTRIDSSALEWRIRKCLLTKIHNLTIVTPSQWLANYVKQSFFSKYPVSVIYNGLDHDKFARRVTSSKVADSIPMGIKVVLGVAAQWEYRKGLSYFNRLAEDFDAKYKIVLVGNMSDTYKNSLHPNIIFWGKAISTEEMIALYQRADVFVNPTLADNFPTTNIESLACGTPVVTFKTGGSAESIDMNSGIAVPQGDYDALKSAIITVCEQNNGLFSSDNCRDRSECFSLRQFNKYVDLYHSL